MGYAAPISDNYRGRKHQRFPTSIDAKVFLGRSEHAVSIKDISVLGCCVSGAEDLYEGDEVVVSVDDLQVVSTVAWVKNKFAGINFHVEINPLRVVRNTSMHPMFLRRRLSNGMMALSA